MKTAQYKSIFSHLRKGTTKYGPAPHKLILLLAVIREFESGRITQNEIAPTEELENSFLAIWKENVHSGHVASFALPFFHLQSDGFWQLHAHPQWGQWLTEQESVSSTKKLRETVQYASLNEDLFELLMVSTSRQILKEALQTDLTKNVVSKTTRAKHFRTPFLTVTGAPMAELTIEEFKRQHPDGVVVDLGEWDCRDHDFVENKNIVLFTYATHSIAIVDYTKTVILQQSNFITRELPGYKIHLLCSKKGPKVQNIVRYRIQGLLYEPLKETLPHIYKVRNAIEKAYPESAVEYEFRPPLTKIEFDIFKELLKHYVIDAEAKAMYSPSGLIGKIQVYIDPLIQPEDVAKRLLDKIKNGKIFKEDTIDTQPDFYEPLLNNFPDSCKVFRKIPLSTLVDRFPADNKLLFTLCYFVNSIHWLYKLSKSTLKIPDDSKIDEIHIILIDLCELIPAKCNRIIDGSTIQRFYQYGVFFHNEEKLLSYLDSLIPYQTVFILKVSKYSYLNYYQIWSGMKNNTCNGKKVKKYSHSEWLVLRSISHTSSDGTEKTKIELDKSFSLSLIGDDLPSVMANFIKQLNGTPEVVKASTRSSRTTEDTHSSESKKKSTAQSHNEPTQPHVSSTPITEPFSSQKQLMLHTHILTKFEKALKDNYEMPAFAFKFLHYFSFQLLQEYRHTTVKIKLPGEEEPIAHSVYEVEVAACREMAKLLCQFYHFYFEDDGIICSKRIGAQFSKVDLIRQIGSFYTNSESQ